MWGGNITAHKFHLVKWEKVTLPKSLGGLDIRNLTLHNRCLLLKWLWRYEEEDQLTWKRVVNAKHGIHSNWCAKVSKTPHRVGP